ncbi:hypothetical protein [Stutzerimonas chloritidismutans]|jgi:hypothetical protein
MSYLGHAHTRAGWDLALSDLKKIVEQGKMFGHKAETLMANEPVPEDWNRPKDFIPDNWDQPAGPSR